MHSNKHGAACGSDGGKSTMLGHARARVHLHAHRDQHTTVPARSPRKRGCSPFESRHCRRTAPCTCSGPSPAHPWSGCHNESVRQHPWRRVNHVTAGARLHSGHTHTHTHTRSLPPAYMHRHNAGWYDTDWDAVTLRATRSAGDCVLLRNPKLGPEVGEKIQGCQDWAATFTSNHQPVHTVTACGKAIRTGARDRSASGLPTGAVGVISSVPGGVTHHSYPLVGWMYVRTR